MMIRKLIFIYSFLFFLSGCFLDQEGKDQSSVEVKLTQNLVDGAPGGAILYLINKDLNLQRSFILTENTLNVDLKQGTWDFALITWNATGAFNGAIRCGLKRGVKLVSSSESVSLNFNNSTCNNSFFTPPGHLASGSMQSLKIVNCLTVTNPTPGTYCDSAAKGFAGSYKLKIFAKSSPTPKVKTSFIAALGAHLLNPSTSGVQELESSCIAASTGTVSTTPVLRVLPFSSPDLFVSAGVEAYADGSCSTGKLSYIYPVGLGDPSGNVGSLTSNTVSKTTATSSSSDIYVAYQSVTLSGPQDFGKVLLSQLTGVSKTLTVINNSPSTATLSVPTYSNSFFSIGTNNCQNTYGNNLPPNMQCTIGVKFTPTSKGLQNATLTMTIDGISKTYSYTGFGVQDTFTTYPQGVSGFSALPSDRVNSVLVLATNPISRYVGTDGGLYFNNGASIFTRTTKNGLGSNIINTIYAFSVGSTTYLYAGTPNGVGISTDQGATFANKLAGNDIRSVFAEIVGSEHRIYVGTSSGLKVSKDGGATWGFSSTVNNGVQKLIVVDSSPTSATIFYSNNKDTAASLPLSFGTSGITASTFTLHAFSAPTPGASLTTNGKVSDMIVHPTNGIYLAVSTGSGTTPALEGLYRFDTSSGDFVHEFSLTPSGFTSVEYAQLAVDASGNILITEKNATVSLIRKLTLPVGAGSYVLSPLSLGPYSGKLTGVSACPNGTSSVVVVGTSGLGFLQATGSAGYSTLTWSNSTTGGLKNNKINSFAVYGAGTSTKMIVGTPAGISFTTSPSTLSSIFRAFVDHDVKAFFADLTNVYFGSKSTNNYVEKSSWGSISTTSFTPRTSTFTSEVNDIFVDSTKEYVATQGSGVAFTDVGLTPSWQWINTTTTNGSLLSNNVKNIHVDSGGVLYLTYSSGTSTNDAQVAKVVITSGGGAPTYNITHYGGLTALGGTITKFYVDSFGKVFLGVSNGKIKRWSSLADLTSATPVTPVTHDLTTGGVAPTINDIFSGWSGTENHLFVASNLGLHIKLDSISSWTLRTTSHGLPTNNVKKVFVDNDYEIYVGTSGPDTEDSGGGFATTKY